MSFEKSSFLPQNRRGLSSVVGALFFTVLMIAGFSVLSLALDAQTDIVTTQRIVSDIEIKKQKEQFQVLASVNGNNILDLGIINQGQHPVEISSFWIINKTLTGEPATRFSVNFEDAFVPANGIASNIVETQTLEITPDTYDIKVVSSLGTIEIIEFSNDGGGGSSGLRVEMITDPPDVIIGQNVTIAMVVTNTGSETIYNVQPDPLDITGPVGFSETTSSHTPTSIAALNGGASVMFTWDSQVSGDSADQLTFTSMARGDGATSSSVSDISVLREPTDGGSGGEVIVIHDDLLSKPGIFMVVPNPFGYAPSGEKGLFGINIVNPTERDMWVNKAVISLLITRGSNADDVFDTGSCSPDAVVPPISAWDCTTDNQMKWEPSPGNQHLIPKKSVQQFLAAADSGTLNGNDELDTILVTGSVFTTLGQFAKTGFGTAFQQQGSNSFPVVNVYLTRDENNPLNVPDIHTTELAMTSGVSKTFYAVLADFDSDKSTWIKHTESRLIINIPRDWTLNSYSSADLTLTEESNGDGSTQLIGVVDKDIDGEGIEAGKIEAGVVEFNVTPPTVSDNTMYVMHILADGYTDANFLIGPIAEVVLQVCPVGGCT